MMKVSGDTSAEGQLTDGSFVVICLLSQHYPGPLQAVSILSMQFDSLPFRGAVKKRCGVAVSRLRA